MDPESTKHTAREKRTTQKTTQPKTEETKNTNTGDAIGSPHGPHFNTAAASGTRQPFEGSEMMAAPHIVVPAGP